MNRPLADQEDRDQAVTIFDHNLSVTAGAGAGKTSLLVERILWAVLVRGIELSRIVAITFTEKAAAELRHRVEQALGAVEEASRTEAPERTDEAGRVLARIRQRGEGPPPDEVVRRASVALAQGGTLSTIHGFASQILRRWPRESDLSPDFAVDDGAHWGRTFQREWPRLIRQRLEGRADADLERTLGLLDVGTLREVVFLLAEFPGNAAQGRVDLVEAGLARSLAPLALRMRGYAEHMSCGRARKYPREVATCADLLERIAERGVEGFGDQLESAHRDFLGGTTPSPPTTVEGVPREEVERDTATAFRLLKALARVREEDTEAILRVAAPLARQLATDFVRQGMITFDGILSRAHRLLAESERVRRQEAARVDLLLIDEFQDTDPLQCEIALLLCATDDSTGSPWERPLVPGRLFLVGDPKQSIYRFRGADLETYHRAVARLQECDGRSLSLTVSFRSPREMVEPLNFLFRRTFDPAAPADPEFRDLDWHRVADDSGPLVEVWSVEDPAERPTAVTRRQAEGAAIARQIQQWHAEGVSYGDVAILLRSLSNLPSYLRPLREAGIPSVVAGGRTFGTRSEVHELLCLLEALADPTDGVAMLGALRSSWLAVPDPELATWVDGGHAWDWAALETAPTEALRTAGQEYRRLRTRLTSEPLSCVLEDLVDQGGLLAAACAAADGAERQRNLRKLLDMVTDQVETLGLPLAEVLPDLRLRLGGSQGVAESNLGDEERDAVRILTIHKAKGLQFPRVLVADVGAQEQSGRPAPVQVSGWPTPHGIRPALGLSTQRLCNLAMVACEEQESAHREAESKRLLYVALTRAQDRLVLVNAWSKVRSGTPWLAALGHWDYAPDGDFPPPDVPLGHPGVLHRRIGGRPDSRQGPASAVDPGLLRGCVEDLRQQLRALRGVAPGWVRPSSLSAEDASASRDGTERDEALDAPFPAPTTACAVGIACHRILQLRGPVPAWDDHFRDRIAAQVAREEGVACDAVQDACREILERPQLKALLHALGGARVLARELPILAREGPQIGRGFIDLVIEEAGRVVVLDYKTDQVTDPAQVAARHDAQLRWYGSAVQRALGLDKPPARDLLLLRTAQRVRLGDVPETG